MQSWPPTGLSELITLTLGENYNIIASGYHHRERAAVKFQLMASISNFTDSQNSWRQVDPHPLNYSNIDIFEYPNWLNWAIYLPGIDENDNSGASTRININWVLPEDSTAYFKRNNQRYILTRTNGIPILLTDDGI